MFKKILVANRGEIAVRIIKACQEMGIETVAVYSTIDEKSPHVALADEAHCIGDAEPLKSYLSIDKILEVAEKSGAEAVHPGYGFLSENPEFAEACAKKGVVFIGPKPEVIRLMGNKIEAKKAMEKAGVPVIPGSYSSNVKDLVYAAEGIGFPVIVKAAAGGGGKGMHIVSKPEHLMIALETARREARSAFGDDTVFIEKYLDGPRHIEFQVLADNYGKVLHLFERECTIQRRHQKIIEETPSTALTPELREKMGKAAVLAAKAVGYTNAGTVEFMMDKHKNFYFLEMNTRLQVEHAITEATTGIDIVKWQIRIASGEEMSLEQKDIVQRGHSIECRIYAEDPERGFLPCTGKFTRVMLPHGINVRHDTALEEGTEITPYYDPMVAKLIVHAESREEAINKMLWALENYVVVGVTTNIDFLKDVLQHPAFKEGNITTHFISEYFSNWGSDNKSIPDEVLIAAAIADYLRSLEERGDIATGIVEEDPHSPWKKGGKWRLG